MRCTVLVPGAHLHLDPPFASTALKHRLTQLDFVVSVAGGREQNGRLAIAGNVFVDGPVMHLVAVGKTFRMPSRVICEPDHIFAKTGRGALKNLVWFIAATQNNLVGLLEIPLRAAARSIDA